MAFNFQIPWGWMAGKKFRTLAPISPTVGHARSGGDCIPPGTLVQCTMVSGMGDVGVRTLTTQVRNQHRARPFELERIEEETYTYEFNMSDEVMFEQAMFRECYEEDIVEWTPDVLNRSWWEPAPE